MKLIYTILVLLLISCGAAPDASQLADRDSSQGCPENQVLDLEEHTPAQNADIKFLSGVATATCQTFSNGWTSIEWRSVFEIEIRPHHGDTKFFVTKLGDRTTRTTFNQQDLVTDGDIESLGRNYGFDRFRIVAKGASPGFMVTVLSPATYVSTPTYGQFSPGWSGTSYSGKFWHRD